MLFKAIRLTVPNFDIDAIEKGLYSIDEVKVINQIATVYSNHGESQKVIHIYDQLLQYIKKHFQNILQSGGLASFGRIQLRERAGSDRTLYRRN